MNWISVKDRLPEEERAVIAFGTKAFYEGKWIEGKFIEKCIYRPEDAKDGWIKAPWVFNSHCCDDCLDEVTHWMPLPDKPENLDIK